MDRVGSLLKQLSLYYEEHVVGEITSLEGNFSFQYRDSWLNHKWSFPISCQIPLEDKIFVASAELFFRHLLPERNIVERMANREGFDPSDLLETLDHLGRDCAGAFVIASSAPALKKEGRKRIDADLLNRFLKADILELNEDEVPKKLSLAGAQDKMPVIVAERKLFTSSEADPWEFMAENGIPIWRLPSGILESRIRWY